MGRIRDFLKRKNIIFSGKRYGIDALGAMAQGLFCTLLVGTILNTIGQQFHIGFLTKEIVSGYTIGGLASAMVGPGIAVAIGFALNCPPLVLFSLIPVGFAANAIGGAGGPLAVYFIAIAASECGKLVSKETKIDILVTPIVTILVGIGLSADALSYQPIERVIYHGRGEKRHRTAEQNKPRAAEYRVERVKIFGVRGNYACHEEDEAGEQVYCHRKHRDAVRRLRSEVLGDDVHTHKG